MITADLPGGFTLEEPGYIVDDGQRGGNSHGDSCSCQRAEPRGLQRVTYRDVTVGGQQQHEPDVSRLRHGGGRPHVAFHLHPDVVQLVEPLCEVTNSVHSHEEEAVQEKHDVCHCYNLKEKYGRFLHRVITM